MTPFDVEKQRYLDALGKEIEDLRARQDFKNPHNIVEDKAGQESVMRGIREAQARGYLDVSTGKNGAVFYDNGQVTLDSTHYDPKDDCLKRDVVRNREQAQRFCAQPGNEH